VGGGRELQKGAGQGTKKGPDHVSLVLPFSRREPPSPQLQMSKGYDPQIAKNTKIGGETEGVAPKGKKHAPARSLQEILPRHRGREEG